MEDIRDHASGWTYFAYTKKIVSKEGFSWIILRQVYLMVGLDNWSLTVMWSTSFLLA